MKSGKIGPPGLMLTLALRQKGLLCMCAVSPRNLSLTSSSATDFYIQVGRGVSHFLLQGHGLGGEGVLVIKVKMG